MRTIGIAIPNYNRHQMTIDSFKDVYDDERIEQITIVDDASTDENWGKLSKLCVGLDKIKLVRNTSNLDCYANKYTSLCYSEMGWNILLDSDNKIGKDYLDRIFAIENWEENAAYLPSWAQPHFDYRKYEGIQVTRNNVGQYSHDPTFTTCLNTANFFVNKNFYTKCWDSNVNPHTADSIYMNLQYLKNGGKLCIVPRLYYNHRVDDHKGEEAGHYNANLHKTPQGFHDGIINELKNMR